MYLIYQFSQSTNVTHSELLSMTSTGKGLNGCLATSRPLKSFFDVARCETENNRPTVRTSRRRRSE